MKSITPALVSREFDRLYWPIYERLNVVDFWDLAKAKNSWVVIQTPRWSAL
jgi:hypothetical protein